MIKALLAVLKEFLGSKQDWKCTYPYSEMIYVLPRFRFSLAIHFSLGDIRKYGFKHKSFQAYMSFPGQMKVTELLIGIYVHKNSWPSTVQI